MAGKLHVVSTPIGNLNDIGIRALQRLQEVDAILCEDTRHSSRLLKHHEVENKLLPFHQHNEHKMTDRIVEQILSGQNLAIITDAGTPGISDPGFMLIRACIEKDIQVEVIPGPTAVITALVGSGLPCEKYVYLGFPPQKKGRQTFWKELEDQALTMVMYESPHRIAKALKEAKETFGPERSACVARELTKVHETFHRGSIEMLLGRAEKEGFKGEIVLIIEGKAHAQKRVRG